MLPNLLTRLSGSRHHVNAAPMCAVLNRQDWVPANVKARVLEWKIRMDLIEYVARGSPEFDLDSVLAYVPRDVTPGSRPEGRWYDHLK